MQIYAKQVNQVIFKKTLQSDNPENMQEETRLAHSKMAELHQLLEKLDLEAEADEEEEISSGLDLTYEQMDQMLGKCPLHTELKKKLEKVGARFILPLLLCSQYYDCTSLLY